MQKVDQVDDQLAVQEFANRQHDVFQKATESLYQGNDNVLENWSDYVLDYWRHNPLTEVVNDFVREYVNSYDDLPTYLRDNSRQTYAAACEWRCKNHNEEWPKEDR
jgi:hypothetical protein